MMRDTMGPLHRAAAGFVVLLVVAPALAQAGTIGFTIKSHLRLLETRGLHENGRVKLPTNVEPLRVFGQ